MTSSRNICVGARQAQKKYGRKFQVGNSVRMRYGEKAEEGVHFGYNIGLFEGEKWELWKGNLRPHYEGS